MARQYTSIGTARFDADISEITKVLNAMDQIPRFILSSIAREIEAAGQAELLSIFGDAVDHQSEDAFPEQFRQHLFRTIEKSKFNVAVNSTSVAVEYDFNQLGDRKDLELAFHQGARLADGTKLDGPYTGQPLQNENAAERHIFWQAVRKRLARAPNPKGPGEIPIDPGAWDATIEKYIRIWGSVAPQWLYLQFGQKAWDPEISSYPIMELFEQRFQEVAMDIFEFGVIEAIEQAERSGVVLTPFGGRLTNPTGELGPSGVPRRPGQFYPIR